MEKMDQNKIPKRKLYTGEEIPAVGLGTFGSDKYGPEAISEAVYGAVKFGYRLIDCAAVYQNEAQIGQVLKRLFDEGVVERKDLFITSKVWNDMHEKVGASCRQSLQDLGLETIVPVFCPLAVSELPCTGLQRRFQKPGFKALFCGGVYENLASVRRTCGSGAGALHWHE